MKKYFIHFIYILAVLAAFTSCKDYLDVLPEGTASLEDVFKTEKQAESFLSTCYHYMPNTSGYRPMPDFCAGGDVMTGMGGTTRYYPYKTLLYNEESATQTYFGLWNPTGNPTGSQNYDVFKGIRYCYIMLDNVDSVPNMTEETRNQWKGEAKFLIAFYHWQLLTYYGPTVIITSEISQNETDEALIYPTRRPYDECVDFIVDLLDESAELMNLAIQPAGKLGRATTVIALALKARVLLYAASPLVNGNREYYSQLKNPDGTHLINQTYDPEKWERARIAIQEAIVHAEDNGYRLYESGAGLPDAERGENSYHELFVGEVTWSNNPEYLWALGDRTYTRHIQLRGGARTFDPFSSNGFNPYVVPTFETVGIYYSKNGLPMDIDPETKDLDLYAYDPASETAVIHLNREPRFYASVGYDRGPYEINNESFTLYCRGGERQGSTFNIANEYQSCTGYVIRKWIHRALAYDPGTTTYTYKDFPFPLIRMAELYLSYAEADFEYNGTLSAQSIDYIDRVRKRSGLNGLQQTWATVGGIPSGDALRKLIQQERLIEFAMESRWFHDLRRWKRIEEFVGHPLRAWNLDQTTAEGFYQIINGPESGVRNFVVPKMYWLAIPLTQININQNLVQNPGY